MKHWTVLKGRLIQQTPISEVSVRLNQFWNRRHRTKQIAMLHTGRCGSTVLGNMLNASRDVRWDGEIFESQMGSDQRTASESIQLAEKTINSSRNSVRSLIYGFETKYLAQQHLSPDCLNLSIESYVDLLDTMGFRYFIVLNRENYLRRTVSALIGKATGIWHSKDPISAPTKVRVDTQNYLTGSESMSLVEFFESADQRREQLMDALSNRTTLVVSYEQDVKADPRIAFQKINQLVKIGSVTPEINLRPTNPFRLKQMIENYDEVREALDGTRYEWMLDDQ